MKKPRVYHDRRPLVIVLRVMAVLLALIFALCVFSFFWFKRYIVIENGQLHLDPPWEYTSIYDTKE